MRNRDTDELMTLTEVVRCSDSFSASMSVTTAGVRLPSGIGRSTGPKYVDSGVMPSMASVRRRRCESR